MEIFRGLKIKDDSASSSKVVFADNGDRTERFPRIGFVNTEHVKSTPFSPIALLGSVLSDTKPGAV